MTQMRLILTDYSNKNQRKLVASVSSAWTAVAMLFKYQQ